MLGIDDLKGELGLNVSTFIGCDAPYGRAETVLFGAPFDSTTSYRPGTRFAPSAMRDGSAFGIEPYSPYFDADIADCNVCDIGDLMLSFGDAEYAVGVIEAAFRRVMGDGKRPLMIGGEHLVTLGGVKAAADRHKDLRILHFDAHADLRDAFFGRKLSHATVLRRCYDIVGGGRIYQLGIRSGDKDEFEFMKTHTRACPFNCDKFDEYAAELAGYPVYLTLDLDVLDSSVMPGTGTPEAGGISFAELVRCFLRLRSLNVDIVAADIVELSPPCDPLGGSVATACKTLREMLLGISK